MEPDFLKSGCKSGFLFCKSGVHNPGTPRPDFSCHRPSWEDILAKRHHQELVACRSRHYIGLTWSWNLEGHLREGSRHDAALVSADAWIAVMAHAQVVPHLMSQRCSHSNGIGAVILGKTILETEMLLSGLASSMIFHSKMCLCVSLLQMFFLHACVCQPLK